MEEVKDTARATVRIGYDGKVYKRFRGYQARERFLNERKVLQVLEERECPFVPRVIDSDEAQLLLVTSNCGARIEHLSQGKMDELFDGLERDYRVRHDDKAMRNVTYRKEDGRFCLIDFEFATITDDPDHRPPKIRAWIPREERDKPEGGLRE